MVVEEIPILKDIIADQQKLIDDMTDKLKAIRTYCYKIAHTNTPAYAIVNAIILILEPSDFKENSE